MTNALSELEVSRIAEESSADAVQRLALVPPASESDLHPFLWTPSLWMPDDLVESTWHEHAPFAFWIVAALAPRRIVELGTHHGFSYLAFCQAVERLGLDCTAFAIDTWKGDEHAGFFGEEVLAALRQRHDARYGNFSHLIPATFDDASRNFQDGTIDLLHIDGRHFYEDVRHDFETWAPKLSDRSVVLLHDTSEEGYGVGQLWKEISARYPEFEFLHGHGLGVLGVGSRLPAPVRALFAASTTMVERIRSLYSRLGAGISDSFARREGERHGTAMSIEIRRLQGVFESQVGEDERLRGHLLRLEDERAKYISEVERLLGHIRRFEHERDLHNEGVAGLSAEISRLTQENERQVAITRDLETVVDERDALAGRLIAEAASMRSRLLELTRQLETAAEAHGHAAERLRVELAEREAALASSEAAQAESEAARAGSEVALTTIRETVAGKDATIAALKWDLAQMRAEARDWQREYRAIRDSRSYRLCAPLRVARAALLRALPASKKPPASDPR